MKGSLYPNAFQVESCFTASDTHVMSGSEDGYVYCWDLVQSTLTHKWVNHHNSTNNKSHHCYKQQHFCGLVVSAPTSNRIPLTLKSCFPYRLEHQGCEVVCSLSPHPSQPLLLTASLGQVWLWSAHPESWRQYGRLRCIMTTCCSKDIPPITLRVSELNI